MLSTVVFLLAVLGSFLFRYSSGSNAPDATMQTAFLLCESWRGVNGAERFDLEYHFGSELPMPEITDSEYLALLQSHIVTLPGGFSALGVCAVELNNVHYYAFWKED